ncbi:hypothetical protein FGO68_gene11700 [Halteria grandinella]|uniref:Uncharacterized protein n=1 Tax=Halteria grandinella TaxID=5974 RepID=A0A8J8NWK4_HALGN|nr:hypothetical protein FGO68_gene11700 [Halteria grandinella]
MSFFASNICLTDFSVTSLAQFQAEIRSQSLIQMLLSSIIWANQKLSARTLQDQAFKFQKALQSIGY